MSKSTLNDKGRLGRQESRQNIAAEINCSIADNRAVNCPVCGKPSVRIGRTYKHSRFVKTERYRTRRTTYCELKAS